MKKALIILVTFPITLVIYILLFTGNIKYTEEIEINTNIDSVITLFDNLIFILWYRFCGTGISITNSLTKYSSCVQGEYLNKSNNINCKLIILKIRQTKCLLQNRRLIFKSYLTGKRINKLDTLDIEGLVVSPIFQVR